MSESPWGAPAVSASAPGAVKGTVVAFLASARPLREAEEQLFLRRDLKG